MFERDWHAWHADYDRPDSKLSRRLAAVRSQIGAALDEAPPGPLRAVSLCAGQGRDLIGVLAEHPRGPDVTALLVELDPRNVAVAAESARRAGLTGVRAVAGDATSTNNYLDMSPVDLVLVCGVFGNLVPADVDRLVGHCTQLCRTGGSVVWTRHREVPDVIPRICDWFEDRGFERLWLSDPDVPYGVGRHRYLKDPAPLPPDTTMFTFVGHDRLTADAPWWS